MIQTSCSWKDIVEGIKKDNPGLLSKSLKFKHLAASLAESISLNPSEVANLANYLDLKWYPRPQGLPVDWRVVLCKNHLAQKYLNPFDPFEYLVVIPPDSLGQLPYIVHRTSEGWADSRWFYEIIPQLENITKDPAFGRPFSEKFNEAINLMFSDRRQGRGMTPGQVHAINLFFEKYVPGLEGICSACFQVMLPRSGAGEKWWKQSESGTTYEIRLSAAKPFGLSAQRTEYVSQTISKLNDDPLYLMWNSEKCSPEYTKQRKQGPTHIPWTIYDFNKFSLEMPLCSCKRRFQ